MKTTIRGLDPDLYQRAKIRARALGLTIGEYFNSALSAKLRRGKRKER